MVTRDAHFCAAVGMVAYLAGRAFADWVCRKVGL